MILKCRVTVASQALSEPMHRAMHGLSFAALKIALLYRC